MKTEKILSTYVTPKTTGYSCAVTLGAAILSGASKNKCLKKAHKPLAWASAGLALSHIGLIEYYSFIYKNKQNR